MDSHEQRNLAPRTLQEGAHRLSRLRLFLRRHRVLKVEDQRIGPCSKRFFHAFRPVAGDKEERSEFHLVGCPMLWAKSLPCHLRRCKGRCRKKPEKSVDFRDRKSTRLNSSH